MRRGDEQLGFRSWPMTEGKPPPDDLFEDEERVVLYRESAVKLRELAGKVRFDFTRKQQLLLMADAFDRAAARIEEPPVKRAAD